MALALVGAAIALVWLGLIWRQNTSIWGYSWLPMAFICALLLSSMMTAWLLADG
jgi:hypothetical protein